MKIGIKIFILILAVGLFSCKGSIQEEQIDKQTSEYDFSKNEKIRLSKFNGPIVSDFDSLFTRSQTIELAELIIKYDIETTRQIAVVTIGSIEPYSDIKKFATDLGRYWEIGTADKDNGLVIVVCNPCKQIGIATGTGTELILTDQICKTVIENTIVPEFNEGNYYDGIEKGVRELMEKWD